MEAKTKKWLWIGGIALTVITIGTIFIVRSNNKKKKQKLDEQNSGSSSDSTSTSTSSQYDSTSIQTNTGGGGSGGTGSGTGIGSQTGSSIGGTLPNGGVGCGSVKADYDGNYYYVKCNGVWYTKTKPNVSVATISSWLSLGNNPIATGRLNSRYPNG